MDYFRSSCGGLCKKCKYVCIDEIYLHIPIVFETIIEQGSAWLTEIQFKACKYSRPDTQLACLLFLLLLCSMLPSVRSCTCQFSFHDCSFESNVYWTVHHCNSWGIKNQLDVACYFLFHLLFAQHVSDINMSIFRSLRLCIWITTSVILFSFRCVLGFAAGDVWRCPFCRLKH